MLEYCLDGAGQIKNEEGNKLAEGNDTELLPTTLLTLCSNFSPTPMPNIPFSLTTAKENTQHGGVCYDFSVMDNVYTYRGNTTTHQINRCEDQLALLQRQKYELLEGQIICQAESGCDINVQNSQGFTALHFLINGRFKYIVKAYPIMFLINKKQYTLPKH